MSDTTIFCETEHDPPEEATHTISLIDSDSAANLTFLCRLCVLEMSHEVDMNEYDVKPLAYTAEHHEQESESNV